MAISVSAESYAKGNVDMDGIITARDAAIVSRYTDGVLEISLSDEQLSLADINGDGEITADDAALIAEKQEYIYGQVTDDYGLSEVRVIENVARLKLFNNDIFLGAEEIRADVDCNGIVDFGDVAMMMDSYSRKAAGLSLFEEGKYYYTFTGEIERSILEMGTFAYGIDSSDYTNINDFLDAANKKFIEMSLSVDGDFELNVNDVSAVLSSYAARAAGIQTEVSLDRYGFERMDINADGAVDLSDATIILENYIKNAARLN